MDGRRWKSAKPVTTETFQEALLLAGRDDGPSMLFDLWAGGRLADGTLAAVLPSAWSAAEYPEAILGRRVWLTLFRMAAYPRPSAPMTLYRGAVPRYARGMAWTTKVSWAFRFASRWGAHLEPDEAVMTYGTPDEQAAELARVATALEMAKKTGERLAHVYEATVAPDGVLAAVDVLLADGRGEAEVVVDPAYLPRPVRRWREPE